jgi:hypothetical protein
VVNIGLRLIAKMLHSGDYSPILQGEYTAEHCITEQEKVLFNFITTYRAQADGVARFPSLSIARSRFVDSGIDIPDPDPGDDIKALTYEAQVHYVKQQAKSIAHEIDSLANSSADPLSVLPGAVAKLRALTNTVQRARHISLADGMYDIVAEYDAGTIMPDGIPWPWPSLQKPTKGMQRGEFVIIAGRPKSRKSFTAFAVGAHACAVQKARVLIFSPEMKRKMVMLRVVASVCRLRYAEFKDRGLDQAEEMRLIEAARLYGKTQKESDEHYSFRMHKAIPDLPPNAIPSVDILESTGKSVGWMESQIELFQPDIVIADSFYRQTADGAKRNDTDWKVMSQLSRNYKDLAMNTNVCLIGTHQLNREAEKSVGSMANLGYSDAFGQDMDLGFRVITGKLEGNDVSALVALGGREFPFDGILINNVPCTDFSELGPITNKKMVEELMKQQDAEDAKEEAEQLRSKRSISIGNTSSIKKVADKIKNKDRERPQVDWDDTVLEGEE